MPLLRTRGLNIATTDFLGTSGIKSGVFKVLSILNPYLYLLNENYNNH